MGFQPVSRKTGWKPIPLCKSDIYTCADAESSSATSANYLAAQFQITFAPRCTSSSPSSDEQSSTAKVRKYLPYQFVVVVGVFQGAWYNGSLIDGLPQQKRQLTLRAGSIEQTCNKT